MKYNNQRELGVAQRVSLLQPDKSRIKLWL